MKLFYIVVKKIHTYTYMIIYKNILIFAIQIYFMFFFHCYQLFLLLDLFIHVMLLT